jgi:hypothetical protein
VNIAVTIDGSTQLLAMMLGKHKRVNIYGEEIARPKLTRSIAWAAQRRAQHFLTKHRNKVNDRMVITILEAIASRDNYNVLRKARWMEDILDHYVAVAKTWS